MLMGIKKFGDDFSQCRGKHCIYIETFFLISLNAGGHLSIYIELTKALIFLLSNKQKHCRGRACPCLVDYH